MGILAAALGRRQGKAAVWRRGAVPLLALVVSATVGGLVARGGLWLLPVLAVVACFPFAALRLEVSLALLLLVAATFYYVLEVSGTFMRAGLGGTFTPWDFAVAVMLTRCWQSVVSPPRGSRERRLFAAVALWGALAVVALIQGLMMGHEATARASRRYWVIPVFFIALAATRTERQARTVWSTFLLLACPALLFTLHRPVAAARYWEALADRKAFIVRAGACGFIALLALHLPELAAPWLRRHAKVLGGVVFLLATACTVMSGGRMALFVLAVVLALSCSGRESAVGFRRACVLAAVAGVAIAWTSISAFRLPISQRWQPEYIMHGTSTKYRLEEYRILWRMAKGQLFYGRGVGAPHARPSVELVGPRRFAERVHWTHSEYLEALFVGGWPLLGAMVAALVCGFIVARTAATVGISSFDRATGRMAVIMVAVSGVLALAAGSIRSPDAGAISMTMLATASNAVSRARTALSEERPWHGQ